MPTTKKTAPSPAAKPVPTETKAYHLTLSNGRGVTVAKQPDGGMHFEFTRLNEGADLKTSLYLTKEAAEAMYTLMGMHGFTTGPIAMTMRIPTVMLKGRRR